MLLSEAATALPGSSPAAEQLNAAKGLGSCLKEGVKSRFLQAFACHFKWEGCFPGNEMDASQQSIWLPSTLIYRRVEMAAR